MPTPTRAITLIVTDLHLAPELLESAEGAIVRGSRLPALEMLLARASDRTSSEWRRWACEAAGVDAGGPIAVAAISRAADLNTTGERIDTRQWWVATAVNLQAAHDHVQLSDVLALDPAEWSQLKGGLAREFGDPIGALEQAQGTEGYIPMRHCVEAASVDPVRIAGSDVHDFLPRGPDGTALRRLMTEMQMWLHEHPVNAARDARGLQPVNALWLWGGGVLPAWHGEKRLPVMFGDDRFLRGLWAMRDGTRERRAAPRSIAKVLAENSAGAVVALALRDLPGTNWIERLGALDRDWLAPALAAMRTRTLDTLRLQANDALLTLRSRDLWRVWRRPRPWLEAFA